MLEKLVVLGLLLSNLAIIAAGAYLWETRVTYDGRTLPPQTAEIISLTEGET